MPIQIFSQEDSQPKFRHWFRGRSLLSGHCIKNRVCSTMPLPFRCLIYESDIKSTKKPFVRNTSPCDRHSSICFERLYVWENSHIRKRISSKSVQRRRQTFKYTRLAWSTTLPAVWKSRQRSVWTWCLCQPTANVLSTNNRQMLYAIAPIRKNIALAALCPHGIRSMPKPILSSLIRFSLHSPRWWYQSITISAASGRFEAIAV